MNADQNAIVEHLLVLNRSTPVALKYTVEYGEARNTGELETWAYLKCNGDGFAAWPLATARVVLEAMATNAYVVSTYVDRWQNVYV